MRTDGLTIIGRAERIRLLDHGAQLVPAKIDSGADISSIWASDIVKHADKLCFKLFNPASEYYTGHLIELLPDQYRQTRIANSFGTKEVRYVVKLRIEVHGRIIKATFTLSDRSSKLYPILLGRRLLLNKFLVDVSKGSPLVSEEKKRLAELHTALENGED